MYKYHQHLSRNHYLPIDILKLELINNKKNCVLASFENDDDEQILSYYTEYENTSANETDIIYESYEDESQSQTVNCMLEDSSSVGELNKNKFNMKLRVL